ncbi:YbjQ family protein [Cellulomonas composti]|uniref:YbjQ family protein n=1 Tax=Cellulomonas composti TaxID=266130 RepID=UPI001FE5C1AA|nr:YbjQ family protein [Cellulomonas composti]
MAFLVSTMNDAPGYRVDAILGEVTGLTVRTRHIGVQFGAGLKSIVGGELRGLTQQLQESRDEAMQRLVQQAQLRGANAVLAMRFDGNDLGNGYQEVVAYGTAVVISQV